jgi:transcription antitermination factor NusG
LESGSFVPILPQTSKLLRGDMQHNLQFKHHSSLHLRCGAEEGEARSRVAEATAHPEAQYTPLTSELYSPAPAWFALRVKPNHEKSVATILRGKGFEEFLPLFRVRRRWTDRVKFVNLPLFPGYLFCRLNLDNRMPLLTTPGLLYIVGNGRTPEPVDESEIVAIHSVLRSGLPFAPWPSLVIGQKVRLEKGPLRGLEGVLNRVGNQHKIYVSVTLLQRSVSVEVDSDWVRSVSRTGAIVAA